MLRHYSIINIIVVVIIIVINAGWYSYILDSEIQFGNKQQYRIN